METSYDLYFIGCPCRRWYVKPIALLTIFATIQAKQFLDGHPQAHLSTSHHYARLFHIPILTHRITASTPLTSANTDWASALILLPSAVTAWVLYITLMPSSTLPRVPRSLFHLLCVCMRRIVGCSSSTLIIVTVERTPFVDAVWLCHIL